jgi:Domain of unknown function (DUF6473)
MSPPVTDISLDYAARDHEIVDYQCYELPNTPGVRFRGPPVDLTGDYFTCIGAAQTLGVYVEKPFPSLLGSRLGIPALNLGVGAAWPGFYSEHQPQLLDHVNNGRFLILQAMSARGEATSRFEPTGAVEMLRDRKTGETVTAMYAWRKILVEEPDHARQYVEELRASWVRSNLALIERVKVPIIFFWFSRRQQDEPIKSYSPDGALLKSVGEFPQFVDGKSVQSVADACTGYAECYSTRGTGHPLVSRFTGEPVQVDHSKVIRAKGLFGTKSSSFEAATNHYYPSPQMHEDAADVLARRLSGWGLTSS